MFGVCQHCCGSFQAQDSVLKQQKRTSEKEEFMTLLRVGTNGGTRFSLLLRFVGCGASWENSDGLESIVHGISLELR